MSLKNQSKAFDVTIKFKRHDTDLPVTFKVDGQRFETSQKTVKFCSNVKYHLSVKVAPVMEFYNLKIAGDDLALHSANPSSGEYTADWNTTGLEPSIKGARENINLVLHGPVGTLNKTLQSKIYDKDDSHAEWGTKLEAVVFKCVTDGQGHITAKDEEWK